MKLARRGREDRSQLTPKRQRWPAFWDLARLRDEIDRLLEAPFSRLRGFSGSSFENWMPSVDVYEDKDKVIIKAELAGLKKDELQVSVADGVLHLSGERKHEAEYEGADSYQSERYFGRFQRDVSLPAAVDAEKIHASYKDGVLTVTCPKTEEAKRKQINVKVA